MNGDAKKSKIHARLLKLAAAGTLTPEAVVADAKPAKSLLHGEFEWDDKIAGHKFRLDQARDMIASVRVYIELKTEVVVAPCYIRDPDAAANEQGYQSVANLRNDKDRALDALISEAGRAAAYMGRVRALAVALDLEDQVDDIIGQFAAFRSRVVVSA